jgi:hypothetical protein
VWNLICHIEGEHRLRVSENRVLREVCGPEREAVRRHWRKLRNILFQGV